LVAPRPVGADVVGSFPAPDGEPLTLVRGGGGRPATLEEVVIGHLAAGRPPRVTRVVHEEAA